MALIGLISDTHGHIGTDTRSHLIDCDEIWHGGDIGDLDCADRIEAIGPPVRMVWGNIDDHKVRQVYPLNLHWEIEGLSVFMTHIGGYPGRYYKRVRKILQEHRPGLYICGHSHILKVMPDKKLDLLHMNPGACGIKGFHKFRTMLKFDVEEGKVRNLRAIELALRGAIRKDEESE